MERECMVLAITADETKRALTESQIEDLVRCATGHGSEDPLWLLSGDFVSFERRDGRYYLSDQQAPFEMRTGVYVRVFPDDRWGYEPGAHEDP